MRPGCTAPMRGLVLGALAVVIAASASLARDGEVVNTTLLDRAFIGIPHHVTLVDPIAFVALDTGLLIVDVTNAAAPQTLGHVYLPGPAFDVEVVGRYAYVADGEGGIQVVDVANTAVPVVVASYPTGDARGIAIAGGFAYVAEGGATAATAGLRVVSVLPTSPPTFGSEAFLPLANGALDVAVSGNVAYVGIGATVGNPDHGLLPVDVSTPLSPVAGTLLRTGKAVHEVVLQGGIAHLATGFNSTGSFVTVNLAGMTIVSSIFLPDAALGVSVLPGVAYVAARSQGLVVFDVNASGVATRRTSVRTGIESVSAAARADAVFLGERSSIQVARLTVVDVLMSPPRIGASLPFAEATGVAATGSLALLLRRDALSIVDASNPSSPSLRSTWAPLGSDLSSVAADGPLVAVAEGEVVHLLDVSDPDAPVFRGDARLTTGSALKPVLVGNALYVVNGVGIEVFDTMNPASGPTASYSTAGLSADFAAADGFGYLVAGDSLLVFDLAGPLTPQFQRSIDVPGEQLYAVAAANGAPRVVASGLFRALYDFALTSPGMPVSSPGSLAGPRGWAMQLLGSKAVVASGPAGIRVYDLPLLVEDGYYDTSGAANAVAHFAEFLYVSALESQHWFVRCDSCRNALPCADAPIVLDNSLRGVRRGTSALFGWELDPGPPPSPPPGEFNVHRTVDKRELQNIWLNTPPTMVATVSAFTYTDSFDPPPGRGAFWQVFGRCSDGSSYPP